MLVARLHEAADRWLASELAAAGLVGLVPSHGDILACLFANGPTDMHGLAAFAHRTKPTTTVLVAKLERLGFVTRAKTAGDARRQLVSLTPAGEALRPVFDDISRRLAGKVREGISRSDSDSLESTLSRILRNFTTPHNTRKQP